MDKETYDFIEELVLTNSNEDTFNGFQSIVEEDEDNFSKSGLMEIIEIMDSRMRRYGDSNYNADIRAILMMLKP